VRTVSGARIVLLLTVLLPACGYSLAGRGTFLPPSIKTIGIPQFINQTPVSEVEQRFTERVRAEFIGRGKYQILPQDTNVDAILRGTITSLSITPTNFNQNQQATRYVITIATKIELFDVKADKKLWENPSMVFREEYDLPPDTAAGDPKAFFGQSSNAVERVANDFARSVVSAILEAF
jgi:hypothetical protein